MYLEIFKLIDNEINMKSLVGFCFQRTTKPNIQKITSRRKAYLTISKRFFFLSNIGAMAIAPYVKILSGHLFFLPIFICGALKTAPYGGFIHLKMVGGDCYRTISKPIFKEIS